MKKQKRVFIYIGTFFLVFVSIALFLSLVFAFESRNDTYLDGKEYDSIEELHADLIETMNNKASDSEDFWIKDLITYFEIEDIVDFVSTYSSSRDHEIEENELFVQFAKRENEKYHLLTPIEGYSKFAVLRIGDKFTYGGDYWYYATIKVNNSKKSICFLYKDVDETRSVYFDGNKTSEHITINPFNNMGFYICYALSFPDSFFDRIFIHRERRHLVELK